MKISKILTNFLLVFLFLYAYSGLLKWLITFVDPTLIFGILSMLSIPVFFYIQRISIKYPLNNAVWIVLGIHTFIFVSMFYTISERYYLVKVGKIFFNLIALLMPILILRNKDVFVVLRICCKSALSIGIIILIYELFNNNLTRIRFQEDIPGVQNAFPDYMSISYFLGTMILYLFPTKNSKEILLLVLAVIFMLLLAAKGPILFLIITLLIIYRKSLKFFSLKALSFVLGGGVAIFLISLITGSSVFSNLAGRLMFFSDGIEADKSSLERVVLFGKAIDIIQSNILFGVGIGGFSKAMSGEDGRLSPHNIFLELWSETGIIPLILLATLVYYLILHYRKLLRSNDTRDTKAIIAICLYMFFGLMVSSYLEDLRLTYFWLGVSIAYFSLIYKSKDQCAD